ncbi:MAG: Ig-like domain-containing protein [Candidatus Manganitrophus sp. SA1]|nr:Ig-like domain-containing protein [Candidatus Manganitrophus morganii]
MLNRTRLQFALGLCLFLLSACGGGGGGSGSGTATQIVITPEQGNLIVGQTISFSAVALTSSGKEVDNVSFSWQSLDPTVASIDSNGVATGNEIGVAIIAVTGTYKSGNFTRTVSGSAMVGVLSPNSGQSNLTFSGTIQYEDRPYDMEGFTGDTEFLPVRGTVVHLVAIDGFATIATGKTDNNGDFSFSGIDNSGRQGGIYIEVVSKTEPDNPTRIEIRNNPDEDALLSLISSGFDDSSETTFTNLEVTATVDSGVGGLFNILDVFSMSSEFIQQEGGLCKPPATDACVPPLLVAYWEPGSSEGSFYEDQLDAIFILGGGDADGDHDEYDDSVIAHEYGHFAVRHFSIDDSPGGAHFITDNKQDIRLSWSEGWGNFFSSAVRKNPIYVDTSTGGSFSFNLENYSSAPAPSTLNSVAIYTTSEIAVTGVLWDLFDGGSLVSSITEPHDQIGVDFDEIWQTLLQFTDTVPVTMETFWLQFESLNPGSAAGLQSIMQERKMELFTDASETSGQTPETTALTENGAAQEHTLYQASPAAAAGDEDVIPFSVTAGERYTLETVNLTNGADTYLFITDSPNSSTPLSGLQNDNRSGRNHQNCGANPFTGNSTCPNNDQTTLSSSINWTASNTTTLYAHVQRSPNAPPSAGVLGSYDIQLKKE